MKSDEVYAGHILDAIERVGRYTAGLDADGFLADEMRQDAVMRQLEVVGEAANRLSDAFKARRPEVPWRDVVRLRHRIAHSTTGVDVEARIIWEVVQHHLPTLQSVLLGAVDG
jgi:uncharacterized protein with HEPN domain